MRRTLASSALAATLSLAGVAAAQDAGPTRVAVFDFELIDTSLDGEMLGPQDAEAQRLDALGEALRAAYAETEGFEVVDIAPVAGEAQQRSLQNCGGCARSFADELGADLAVTGTVQKVSNLILNINLYLVDEEGREQAHSADIRGNTDESWSRGLDWLIRNRLRLKE